MMPTLTDIETAAAALPLEQQKKLLERLYQLTRTPATSNPGIHSVLDIPAVSLGGMISGSSDDDLLGEMLEGRL